MQKPSAAGPLELVFTLILAAAILYLVGPEAVIGAASRADMAYVLAASFTYFCVMLLMAFRMKLVLLQLGEKIGLASAYAANAAGMLLSDFTPARSGYFITPFVLRRKCSVRLERGMVAIVSPQMVDFFTKAAAAAAAIALVASSIPQFSAAGIFLWLGVGLMLSFCIAMWAALFAPPLLGLARKLSFVPYVSIGCDFLESLQAQRKRAARLIPLLAALSVAGLLLKGLEWHFFGLALGVEFSVDMHPLLVFMLLQPLITAFQFVPFPTLAGIGISEGSAVASMALLGVPTELAVAFMLLVRAATIAIDCYGIPWLLPFVTGRR